MILKEISNRRSIRKYKADPVPQEYVMEIIKAGQFAPTARNNRALEFVVVKDQGIREKIFGIVGQDFVKEAQVLIVPAIDGEKTICPVQDLSVASENMFLQATALGLGTVWKNLKTELNEEAKIKEMLDIPERYRVINIIPVGFSAENPEPYSDKDFSSEKIHEEKW